MKKSLLSFFAVIALVATVAFIGATASIRPVFAEGVYTVSYYDGSELLYSEEVEEGGFAALPATPQREGLVFLYWKNNGERFNFSTPVTDDVRLDAEWLDLSSGEIVVVEMCSVRFIVWERVVSVQSVEKGGDAIAPTIFDLPEGKKFYAWARDFTEVTEDTDVYAVLISETYTVTVYGLGDEPIAKVDVDYGEDANVSEADLFVPNYLLCEDEAYAALKNVTEDRTVYLNYVPVEYTATFTVDGEIFAESAVGYGTTVRFPAVPQKAGYTFIGWYDGDEAYDFSAKAYASVTLEARFAPIEKKKYDVVFYDYGGVQYGEKQRIEEGKKAIAPGSPEREGYEFIGWADASGASFDLSSAITADTALYPRYKTKTYSVKVVAGDEVVSEQFVKYGENAVEPRIAAKEGYDFAGFDGSFRDIRKDTVITAKFAVKTFTVTFIDKSFKKMGATQYVEYGKSAVAPKAAEIEGFKFVGWSEDFAEVKDDLVIYPEYEKLVFTVTYLDGEEVLRMIEVSYGDKAIGFDEEKDGFIFAGYATTYGEAFDMNTAVLSSVTLVAVWEEIPDVYFTVTFYVDGAIYSVQQIKEGDAARTPADPIKYGYDFAGWDEDFASVTGDLSVSAEFVKKTFVVTFTADGKTVAEVPVEFEGKVAAVSAPEKEGYDFVRWNFDFDTEIVENVSVKAVYRIKTFVVTFVIDGETYEEQEVEYGDYAEIPETPFVDGRTFKGWFAGGKKFRFSSAITADTTIAAEFEQVTFILTYVVNGEEYAAIEYAAGDAIVSPAMPELGEDERFVEWLGEPETMPSRNVRVRAVTERRYLLTYYINNNVYASEKVWEGEVVEAMPAPELDESVLFYGWLGEPDAMPAANVSVIADIFVRGRYVVSYYFNGALYAQTAYYEGDAVDPAPAPENYDEDVAFVCWTGEPEVMPNANVNVVAQSQRRYTITYYIFNEQYLTRKLWQGEIVEKMGEPELSAGLAFNGWIGEPDVMPEGNVVVTADVTSLQKHVVRYYVFNELYYEAEYYAGETVEPLSAPELPAHTLFAGWDKEPAIMPDGDVEVTCIVFVEMQYAITYYVGNRVEYRAIYYAGDIVEPYAGVPEVGEHEIFYGWMGEPEKMPSRNVDVYASVGSEEEFSVTYFINGEAVRTQFYYEGDRITVPEFTVGEHEYIAGWTDLPETMPNNNIEVHAIIEEEEMYTVTYMYGENVYSYQDYYAGDRIVACELAVGEHEIFVGWADLPETMPAENVTVYAIVEEEAMYTLTYYAYGEKYGEQYYYIGEKIYPLTIEVGEHEIFYGWKGLTETMPGLNYSVFANIVTAEQYSLVYYVDGKLYATYSFYEGESVYAHPVPSAIEGFEFVGWEGLPETMPAHDVAVYGYHKEIVVAQNEFVLYTVEKTDEYAIVALRITGNVDVAGFLGYFYLADGVEFDVAEYDEYTSINYAGRRLAVIWTVGSAVTEDRIFIGIKVYAKDFDLGMIDFVLDECKTFDGDEVVDVGYTVTKE